MMGMRQQYLLVGSHDLPVPPSYPGTRAMKVTEPSKPQKPHLSTGNIIARIRVFEVLNGLVVDSEELVAKGEPLFFHRVCRR